MMTNDADEDEDEDNERGWWGNDEDDEDVGNYDSGLQNWSIDKLCQIHSNPF